MNTARHNAPPPGFGSSLQQSIQVLGEIHAGIAKLMRSGSKHELDRAGQYRQWVDELVEQFAHRILPFDLESAQLWGVLLSGEKKDPHTIDKQIAAIAMTNDLTVVTRDKGEAFSTIATLKVLNPFQQPMPPPEPKRH